METFKFSDLKADGILGIGNKNIKINEIDDDNED